MRSTTATQRNLAFNITPMPRVTRFHQHGLWSWRVPFLSFTASLMALLLGIAGAKFHLDVPTASSLYFLLIVAVSLRAGFWSASIVSLIAVLCEAYFIAPPAFNWHIADRRNLVTIVVFEISVLLITRLSTHKQQYALETEHQRIKLQNLYAITRGSLQLDLTSSPEQQLAELMLHQFRLDAVLIHNESECTSGVAGRWAGVDANHLVNEILTNTEKIGFIDPTIQTIALTGSESLGRIVVEGAIRPSTLEAVAALIVLILDRHKTYLRVSKAEAARQAEQLRVTVLDSLAHAFKTPLTVIRAASSGLLENEGLDPAQKELTNLIDENAERMSDLATRLLQAACIQADDVKLDFQPIDVGVLLNDVVYHARTNAANSALMRRKPSPIRLDLPQVALRVRADYNLLRATVTELIDNALKYSEEGQPVTVNAWLEEEDIVLSVHSWSGVVPPGDSQRIFERFYRSASHSASVPGTGLGLSIARVATDAHQGEIWLHSEEGVGTTFYISLPVNRADGPNPLPESRIN